MHLCIDWKIKFIIQIFLYTIYSRLSLCASPSEIPKEDMTFCWLSSTDLCAESGSNSLLPAGAIVGCGLGAGGDGSKQTTNKWCASHGWSYVCLNIVVPSQGTAEMMTQWMCSCKWYISHTKHERTLKDALVILKRHQYSWRRPRMFTSVTWPIKPMGF